MTKIVVEINCLTTGSTGKIMFGIAETARQNDFTVYTFSPPGRSQRKNIKYHSFIGSIPERRISEKINILTGGVDKLNLIGTYTFINKLKKIRPDIIHLHNIHGNYINLEMLFRYLKKSHIPLVWTLHDCWAFTGQCPYFDILNCKKWLETCSNCNYKGYPAPRTDHASTLFQRKKKLFTNIDNAVIVLPSQWLADLTKQSFLKKHPIQVINNGIDLKTFKPQASRFREAYGLQDKFIILDVAYSWGYRKGNDRLERLAEVLDDRFKIVVVGISNMKSNKIICIPRTENQSQLAEIYTAADVLLNPTREDNFPTVNIEALACGTPVLSYGAGGSAEAFDEKSGLIVNDDTVVDVLNQLICNNFKTEDCIARGWQFNQDDKFMEYVHLYNKLLEEK